MSLEDLERMSRLVEPYEFYAIKLSGGEPTLHPQFVEICDRLRDLFPARAYLLATNGKLLERYLEQVQVFDRIDLSEYPGMNEEEFHRLYASDLSNLSASTKYDYTEMEDIHAESNHGKTGIFASCHQAGVKKIVQDRIYACCVIFGNSIRQGIDRDEISVPMDEHWRERLARVDIEAHCRRCWVDVRTGRRSGVRRIVRRAWALRRQVLREMRQGRWRALRTRARLARKGLGAV
jgi:sulfatase maturation enzyme AslB (radical SAM superfamily)